jgi:hypothetical protein
VTLVRIVLAQPLASRGAERRETAIGPAFAVESANGSGVLRGAPVDGPWSNRAPSFGGGGAGNGTAPHFS